MIYNNFNINAFFFYIWVVVMREGVVGVVMVMREEVVGVVATNTPLVGVFGTCSYILA